MSKKQSDSSEFTEADYIDFIATPHTEVLVEFSWFRCILKYTIFSIVAIFSICLFISVAFWIRQAYKDEASLTRPVSEHESENNLAQDNDSNTQVAGNKLFDDKSTRRLIGHKKLINALCVSPDNQWILSGEGDVHYSPSDTTETDRTINPISQQEKSGTYYLYVWNYTTGRPERMLTEHQQPITAVVFSSDGKMAASADNGGTFVIWDAKNWTVIDKYTSENRFNQSLEKILNYKCLAFSANNLYLAVGGSVLPAKNKEDSESNSIPRKAVVVLWDISQHREITKGQFQITPESLFGFSRQCDCVFSIAYIESGKTLIAGVSGADSGIYLLDRTGEITKIVDVNSTRSVMGESITQHSSGHDSPFSLYVNAALRFDQRRIIGTDNIGRMTLWNYQAELPGLSRVELLDKLKQSSRVDQNIRDVKYSNDGKYFITCGDEICIWNGLSENIELIGYLSPPKESLYQSVPYYGHCIAMTPDGESLLVGCSDKIIRIWDYKHFDSSVRKVTAIEIESKIRHQDKAKIDEPMELDFRTPRKKNL